jgi:hypothetical protein
MKAPPEQQAAMADARMVELKTKCGALTPQQWAAIMQAIELLIAGFIPTPTGQ